MAGAWPSAPCNRRPPSTPGTEPTAVPPALPLEDLLRGLLVVLGITSSLFASGHALLWKRDPRATLGWIGLCLTVPFVGPLVYLMFGVNRVRRRALAWQQEGRRIPGGSGAWRAAPPPRETGHGTEHLAELKHLVDQVS